MEAGLKKIIFMHMPKCAGRSIEDFFKQNTKKWNVVNDSDILNMVDIEAVNHFDVIMGHLNYWSVERFPNYKVMTILRDPLDRAISHYNHLMTGNTSWKAGKLLKQMKMSFLDFVKSDHPDIMGLANIYTMYLLGDVTKLKPENMVNNAKDNLKKLDFVGIYEDMHQTIKQIKERYGLKGHLRRIGTTNSKNKIDIPERQKKQAVKYLYDYEVYQLGKQLYEGGA